jgi:hypothetical protein
MEVCRLPGRDREAVLPLRPAGHGGAANGQNVMRFSGQCPGPGPSGETIRPGPSAGAGAWARGSLPSRDASEVGAGQLVCPVATPAGTVTSTAGP